MLLWNNRNALVVMVVVYLLNFNSLRKNPTIIMLLIQQKLHFILLISGLVFLRTIRADFCGFPSQNLPNWFAPKHYHIELQLDPNVNKFSGFVAISMEKLVNTKYIVLHAAPNLTIKNVQVLGSITTPDNNNKWDLAEFDTQIPWSIVCQDEHYELFVIEFDSSSLSMLNNLRALKVTINFEGFTPNLHKGLVRINYQENKHKVLYTKFDRFKGHFLIPCFDESRYKSTIKLVLDNVLNDYAIVTFSSAPIVSKTTGLDGFRYEFANAPQISINQFGFVMANNLQKPRLIKGHFIQDEHHIQLIETMEYTTNQKLNKFSQQTISLAFSQIETYLDVKFTRKALKIVLLPGIGEQELEVFQQAALIIADPLWLNHIASPLEEFTNSELKIYYVARVTEMLAYQWFGYLLSLTYDDEIWLFEGFVGWLALRITDDIIEKLNENSKYGNQATVSPPISYRLLFNRNELSQTMYADASGQMQPMASNGPINTRRYLQSKHDFRNTIALQLAKSKNIASSSTNSPAISTDYQLDDSDSSARGDFKLDKRHRIKAIALVILFEDSCWGQFKLVIETIFELFKWNSMQVKNLTLTIANKCKWTAPKSMKHLLETRGFPLVKASLLFPDLLELSQDRFLSDYTQQQDQQQQQANNNENSVLTITYIFGHKTKTFKSFTYRLMGNNYPMRPSLGPNFLMRKVGSWVKLNTSGHGYYRVLYSDLLMRGLKMGGQYQLDELDSLNLLDDALAIFRAGYRGAYYLVGFMKGVATKTNELIRQLLIEAFIEFKQLYGYNSVFTKEIRLMGIQLFSDDFLLHKFNVGDLQTDQAREGRGKIFELLAMYDFEPIILESLEIFRSPQLFRTHRDLHGAILIAIARYGTDDEVQQLLFVEPNPTNEVQRKYQLDKKIVVAMALAKNQQRLTLGWLFAKNQMATSPKLIIDFVSNLFHTIEGELFLVRNVLGELGSISPRARPSLYQSLGHELYLELMLNICVNVTDMLICNPQATFLQIFQDQAQLSTFINTFVQLRRRKFFMQQLDVNKLVF